MLHRRDDEQLRIMNKKNRKPSLVLLFLLVSFPSVSAVLFTPALPLIQSFFNLSVETAQLTITVYLLGYALGQLPYGPLANAIGRKKSLLIGISLATLGSLLCAFSSPLHSFSLLIIGRFLQALGASAGLKISFTMVADSFAQIEATKMISRLIIAFAIMPGISVAIGGWLTHVFAWESCFYFLALFGILMFGLSLFLSETAQTIDRSALEFTSIIKGYRAKLKNQRLILCSLLMGCCSATVYIFASKAPFIGINLIGLSPVAYGALNLLPSLGMLIGALFAERIAGKVPLQKLLLVAIFFFVVSTLFMFVPFLFAIITIFSLFLPMIPIYIAETVILANVSSYGLTTATNKANASAVLNFINVGTAVIAVLFAEFIFPESPLLLPLFFIILSIIMFFFWKNLKKMI